ncbi:hypothetical protein LAZ67_21000835 [Cordylochernes scorpioides]|uniref:Homing endonuclease LAGLIDADG domain-containing protein n=1 Tax=Cordylochernes scorpioides TaxID=51811 RepID=A0ABY6LMJ4_9ARAC|nr:hypothetical protein LAZ67_21000835 [Cordylochernes scorpioides]
MFYIKDGQSAGSYKFGFKLNISKTKNITTAVKVNIFEIQQEKIDIIDRFILLGSRINKMGSYLEEVKKGISFKMKKRLVEAFIFLVITYEWENWTLRKKGKKNN